jgi:hypothetical protein
MFLERGRGGESVDIDEKSDGQEKRATWPNGRRKIGIWK